MISVSFPSFLRPPSRVIVAGPEMVLLHAFKKQGQRTSRDDLDVARRRAKDVIGGAQ